MRWPIVATFLLKIRFVLHRPAQSVHPVGTANMVFPRSKIRPVRVTAN
jgi:hypothetical protein